ncbi:hypothetical protein CHS0354_039622 [Potamilus streckersoni]|uniref:Uncharacterized protein n=1 Tax=Potamilus streckersoni TaxID=2493646 RepID=A0AAE0SVS4_9BIVA|nr:hypothetical protein CHS0354_039622 [Potamilus streckersoni]
MHGQNYTVPDIGPFDPRDNAPHLLFKEVDELQPRELCSQSVAPSTIFFPANFTTDSTSHYSASKPAPRVRKPQTNGSTPDDTDSTNSSTAAQHISNSQTMASITPDSTVQIYLGSNIESITTNISQADLYTKI